MTIFPELVINTLVTVSAFLPIFSGTSEKETWKLRISKEDQKRDASR